MRTIVGVSVSLYLMRHTRNPSIGVLARLRVPEPSLVSRLQEEQGHGRRVEVAPHGAQVVARALVRDPAALEQPVGRAPEQEGDEPVLAIANRRAIHLEDVAESHPVVVHSRQRELGDERPLGRLGGTRVARVLGVALDADDE